MAEPMSSEGAYDPSGDDLTPDLMMSLLAQPAYDPATDPNAVLPGDPDGQLQLLPAELADLESEIEEILTGCDQQTKDRRERLKEIDAAYDLIPDPKRSGVKPDASRLVSERTRADCYVASSRLTQGIMGVEPMMVVEAVDDSENDLETEEQLRLATETEEFFEHYAELNREEWLPLTIQRATRQGDAVLRAMWEEEECPYTYRDANGRIVTEIERKGRITVKLIDNEYVYAWPLNETDYRRLTLFGFDSYLSTAEFRTFCRGKGVPKETQDEILASARKNRDGEDAQQQRLKNKDIDASRNPFEGEIRVSELWYTGTLPGEDGLTGSFLIWFHRDSKTILWIGVNPLGYGRRSAMVKIPYWREDGSFWSTGIGQELLYVQAADSTFWNMWVDNLKVIGNNVRIIKTGTGAYEMASEIGPGKDIFTDDPESDIKLVALGGDLTHIMQASQQNDFRGTKLTAITPPLQGMGDPVMKSGASPSSIAQLIEQASTKFGQVDKNIRHGLSDLYMLFLELLQQYAPEGVFYEHASQESADQLLRMKFQAPSGDLRKKLRIRAKAPSATSNREMLKSHLGIVYQMAQQHMMMILQVGGQILAQENLAGFQRMAREAFAHLHKIYLRLLEAHDIPGASVGAPKMPEKTPEDVQINELTMMVQQAQQIIEQLQMQLAQATGQVPPGAMMEGQGAEQPVS